MEALMWKLFDGTKIWAVTFWPRFFIGFGHFHGFTRLGPIQVTITLEDRFSVISCMLSGTQSRLSQSMLNLKKI